MHVLIACAGSAGDVHPFIAIGLALQRRGHAVELMAPGYFRPRIERAGLACVPVGTPEEFDAALRDPDLWHPRRGLQALARHMAPWSRSVQETLLDHVRGRETVLVGSSLAFGVRLLQEHLRLPAATVHLAPSAILSAASPSVWPGLSWLRALPTPAARALLHAAERWQIDPALQPSIAPAAAAFGLPLPSRILGRWMHSPQRVICAFPEWYAAPAPDWPPHTVCVGFPRWAQAGVHGLHGALEESLAGGPPPIAFTPGSAMAHGRRYFERALEACARLGRRCLMISAFPEQLPAPLPPDSFHVAYSPYGQLAPRVAAFVHHGGIGTAAEALAAGVPQLVTPFAHDQFDNGARLERLGVAASVAPQAPARRWAARLKRLLDDADVAAACRAAALRMSSMPDPAARAADLIEALRPRA